MVKKKGFTLVELMIVVGLLGISLTLTTGILLSVVKTTRKQEILRSLERNGEAVMRQVDDNVRKANSVRNSGGVLRMQIPTKDGPIITRYIGQVNDTGNCTNNYIYMTEAANNHLFTDVANRITNSVGDGIGVREYTIEVYDTDRPVQVFVKLTLESCYDTSMYKTFQTFVTARGTYY